MEILVITHTAAASKTRIGRKHPTRKSLLDNVNHQIRRYTFARSSAAILSLSEILRLS